MTESQTVECLGLLSITAVCGITFESVFVVVVLYVVFFSKKINHSCLQWQKTFILFVIVIFGLSEEAMYTMPIN